MKAARTLLVAVAVLCGCHGSRPVRLKPPTVMDGYSYFEKSPGVYIVVTRSSEAVKRAVKDLKCKPCVIDEMKLYLLQGPAPQPR